MKRYQVRDLTTNHIDRNYLRRKDAEPIPGCMAVIVLDEVEYLCRVGSREGSSFAQRRGRSEPSWHVELVAPDDPGRDGWRGVAPERRLTVVVPRR